MVGWVGGRTKTKVILNSIQFKFKLKLELSLAISNDLQARGYVEDVGASSSLKARSSL